MITNVIVTAYCHCVLCCGTVEKKPTASGAWPREGVTIAAPRHIPFGTRVEIDGRVYVVQDRTAKRFDGRWDIFMNSHKEAKKFGKQKRGVKILFGI
jgi:3D (Asp-Asp-Asp) domain-containing protein